MKPGIPPTDVISDIELRRKKRQLDLAIRTSCILIIGVTMVISITCLIRAVV